LYLASAGFESLLEKWVRQLRVFFLLVFSQYLEENAETVAVGLELHPSELFSVHY
jgi:hypothetical protein